MLSWRYTCACVCKCECLSVVCICSPRSLSVKTQLMSWIVVLKLKVLSCASESEHASLFSSSLNGNSLLKTTNCLVLCSNEACGIASWTLSHGSVSIFNTCRTRRHTEIIPNDFVSNQAGFLHCYLSEGRAKWELVTERKWPLSAVMSPAVCLKSTLLKPVWQVCSFSDSAPGATHYVPNWGGSAASI